MADVFDYLLDSIYTAAEDPRQWESVLAALTSHLSGCGAALHTGPTAETGFSFGTAYNIDPESLAAYASYYHSMNPLNAPLSRIPVGVAVSDHQLVRRSELERTEFYNDYGRQFGIAGAVMLTLARDGHGEANLSVVGGFGSDVFSEGQVSFVQRLAPHLSRALALNRRLAGLQAERDTFQTMLDRREAAVLLLGEEGTICYCNEAGIQLLRRHDGLAASRGRLCALDANAQNLLAGLVRAALAAKGARGGSIPVPRQHSARPLHVKVMPFAQKSAFWLSSPEVRAIVFVSDPESPAGDAVSEVMDAYNLTPSEKSLLNELIAGRSLREAAENLGITRATSRNRLARIMAKTDTHRQSELLQLILRSSVPAR